MSALEDVTRAVAAYLAANGFPEAVYTPLMEIERESVEDRVVECSPGGNAWERAARNVPWWTFPVVNVVVLRPVEDNDQVEAITSLVLDEIEAVGHLLSNEKLADHWPVQPFVQPAPFDAPYVIHGAAVNASLSITYRT